MASIRGKPEAEPAMLDVVVTSLERKIDSLVEAIIKMLREEQVQQQPLINSFH